MESTKRRHQVNLIERPPFYHLPRSRPVSFERPTHLRCENNCGLSQTKHFVPSQFKGNSINKQQQQHQTNKMCTCANSQCNSLNSSLSSSSIYNSSPKPYSRQEINDSWQQRASSSSLRSNAFGGCQCSYSLTTQQQQTPRIMVNGQQANPTSTVHKSLANSQLRQQHTVGESGNKSQPDDQLCVHYSRLISPTRSTTTTTSCECPATSAADNAAAASTATDISAPQQQKQHQRAATNTELESGTVRAQAVILQGGENFARQGQAPAGVQEERQFWNRVGSYQQREHVVDSNVVKPDSKRDEFMSTRQLERATIAHQTYRTVPIVSPKPKALYDLPSGTYMGLSQDPTWELTQLRPSSANSGNSRGAHERKIQVALNDARKVTTNASSMCPVHANHMEDETPIFDYPQYIKSTRRGY